MMDYRDKRFNNDKFESMDIKGSTQPLNLDNQELADEIREEFMNAPDDPAENVAIRHPNRNTDKPSIDKPPYS